LTKNKVPSFDRAQVLAPLVIGITGHRDIREEDRPGLEDKVKEIFLKLRQDYSSTPLILVSALAEGADRLAADAALSLGIGVRLVAVTPMPIDLYAVDFDSFSVLETSLGTVAVSSTSREEFSALLDKADGCFELGLAEGNHWDAVAKPGPERDRQYELVGQYIARQSQILIALWDGVESNRVGGTASVIHFQIEGVPGQDPCALEAAEGFPVYHILTPRLKNPFPQGEVLNLRAIYPEAFNGNHVQAEKYYRHMFDRLDQFNRYITREDGLAGDVVQSKSDLLQDAREDELPAEAGPALNRYAVADALAIRFQQHLFWAQILLHLLTFSAFSLFLLFVHLPGHWYVFLISSWILFAAVLVLVNMFGKWALDTQHEDYRAMAEGLRVRFFWNLAGIKDSVAEHYLGKQRSELDWIRNGFRGWSVLEGPQDQANPDSLYGDDLRDRLGFVRKYWIDHQQSYFGRAAKRNHRYHELIERFGLICIAGVCVLGLVLLAPWTRNNEWHLGWAAIGLEALLAGAAILHHFNNRMGYAEYAKQYGRMASLFARGSDLVGKFLECEDYDNTRMCVKKVGVEALTENGDWVLLRRERPLEVPHP
jgi:hypothetical protein